MHAHLAQDSNLSLKHQMTHVKFYKQRGQGLNVKSIIIQNQCSEIKEVTNTERNTYMYNIITLIQTYTQTDRDRSGKTHTDIDIYNVIYMYVP